LARPQSFKSAPELLGKYGKVKRRHRTKLSKLDGPSTEDGVRKRQQASVQKHFSDNYMELVRQQAAANGASRKTEGWIHSLMLGKLETEVFGEMQEFRSAARKKSSADKHDVSGYELVEHRRQATASTAIQSLWRVQAAKREVEITRVHNNRISAAVVIATSVRMKLARDKVRSQRRVNAVTRIQGFLRGVMAAYRVNVKRTEAPDVVWDQLHGRKNCPAGVPIDSSYIFVPRVLRHSCLKKATVIVKARSQEQEDAIEAQFSGKSRARRNSTSLEAERGVAAARNTQKNAVLAMDDLPIPSCKLQGVVMNIEVCGMMEAMRFYMMKANRELGHNGSLSTTLAVSKSGHRGKTWKDSAKHISQFLNKVMGAIVTVCEEYGGDVLSIKGAGPTLQVLWACTPPQHVYTPVAKQETRTKAVIQAAVCSRVLNSRMASITTDEFLEPGAVPPLALQMAIGCGAVNLVHVGGLCGRWDVVVSGETIDNLLLADSVGFGGGMCSHGDVVLESRAWTAIRDVAVGERLMMAGSDNGMPGAKQSTSKSRVVRLLSLAHDIESLSDKRRTRNLPVPPTVSGSDCVSLIRSYVPSAMHKILDARARKVQQLLVEMGETAEATADDAPPQDIFDDTSLTPVIVSDDDDANKQSAVGRNRSSSLEDIGEAGVLANAITTSMSQAKQRDGERKRKTVIWRAQKAGPNAQEINSRLETEWNEMSKREETSAVMDHMELYDVRIVSILSVRLYGAGASQVAAVLSSQAVAAGPGGVVKKGKVGAKGARKMSGAYSSSSEQARWAFAVDCMKIRALSCHAQRAVYENEGSMSENRACYIPDGTNGEEAGNFIMLTFVFGLPPLCHTDDPARAVAAARLMISQLEQTQKQRKREVDLGLFRGDSNDGSLADPDFGFAAAVVTGRTFYGVVGTQSRQQLLLHGEQVHQANELCRLAKRGEILVDSTTAKLTKDMYTFGDIEEFRGGDGLNSTKGTYKSRHARARALSGNKAATSKRGAPEGVQTSRKQRGTVFAHPSLGQGGEASEPLSPASPGKFLRKQRGTVYQHPDAVPSRTPTGQPTTLNQPHSNTKQHNQLQQHTTTTHQLTHTCKTGKEDVLLAPNTHLTSLPQIPHTTKPTPPSPGHADGIKKTLQRQASLSDSVVAADLAAATTAGCSSSSSSSSSGSSSSSSSSSISGKNVGFVTKQLTGGIQDGRSDTANPMPVFTPANKQREVPRTGMVRFSADDDEDDDEEGDSFSSSSSSSGSGGGMVRFSGGVVEKTEDAAGGGRDMRNKPRHTIRGAANIKLLGTMRVIGKVPPKSDNGNETAGWLAQKKRAQLLQADRANLRLTLESRARSHQPAGPVTIIGSRGSGKVRMVQDIIAFGHENGFTILTGSTKKQDEDKTAGGDTGRDAASEAVSVSKTNNLEVFWRDDALNWMRDMSEWTETWTQIIEQCIQLMRIEKRRVDIFTLEAFLREQLLPPEMRELWVLVRDVFNIKTFLQSEVDPLSLDVEKLEKLFKGRGVKIGNTPQDIQKLTGLCNSIAQRKCTLVVMEDKSGAALSHERLIVTSDVITVIIRSEDRVLVELFEFPPNGQVIEKMSVLQSVLVAGQPWIEGAYLCVRRKLGVKFDQIDVLEHTYVREVITGAQQGGSGDGGKAAPGSGAKIEGAVGVSFAGLERQCVHHIVEVRISGLPSTDRFVIAQTMEHEMQSGSSNQEPPSSSGGAAVAARKQRPLSPPDTPKKVQPHQRSQWAWFSKHALKDLPHVTAVLNYQTNCLEHERAEEGAAGRKGRRQSMMELGTMDQHTRNEARVEALTAMVKSFAEKVGPVILLMQLRIGTSVTGQPRMTDDSWSLVRKLKQYSMTKSKPGFIFAMVGRPEISTAEFRDVLKTSVANGACVRISALDERERWEYLQNILDVFTIPFSLGAFMSRVAAGNPSDIELVTKYLVKKGFIRVNKKRKVDMTSDIYEALKQQDDSVNSMLPDKLLRHVTGRFECLTHRHQAVVKMAGVQCTASSTDLFTAAELIDVFEAQKYMKAEEVSIMQHENSTHTYSLLTPPPPFPRYAKCCCSCSTKGCSKSTMATSTWDP
jgi:class 3 adenylate cyclase